MMSSSLFLPRRRSGQSGIAAIALVVVLVIFCGLLLAGTVVDKERDFEQAVEEQQETLRWAERGIDSFTALHGRPPCPASEKNGAENCAGFAKGWLPVKTLEQFGLSPATSAKNHADVRYVVYRGMGGAAADPDLADPTPFMATGVVAGVGEGFSPSLVDSTAVAGYPAVSSSADLCGKLRSLLPNKSPGRRWDAGEASLGGTGRPDRAHIVGHGVPGLMNVAYALAVALPGKARPAGDLNASQANLSMESPQRRVDSGYTDIVRAVDPGMLYERLACGTMIASLDNLAIAQAWTADAAGMKAGNVQGGKDIERMGMPIAIGDGAFLASDLIDTANGIYNQADNAANLAGSVLSPALFLNYITGGVIATQGLILSAIDIARSTVNLAVDSLFVVRYVDVGKAAEKIPVWTDGAAILQKADEIGLVEATAR